MQLTLLLGLAALSCAAPTAQSDPKATVAALVQNYQRNLATELKNGTTCNSSNIAVRKSWSDLTASQRTSYLNAVQCINTLPNKMSHAIVPGARNRADDFTYAHINQTNFIHNSGLLLPWHRQFVWAYEQALRNECKYNGYLPYWDWSEFANNQSQSSVFDGTPTSFGSNGKFVPHSASNASLPGLPSPVNVVRPPGSGGGCIASTGGLGSNFTINLGPVAPANNTPDNTYGLKYNPRCLKRDFLTSLSASALTYANVSTLLLTDTIHSFRPTLEASMHPAAHSSTGGDLYDLYSSPSDPVFFLLHSQIDRLWTIWQGQNFTTRTYGLDGTVTFLNDPPSPNATLSTVMHMFMAGGEIPIGDTMSSYNGNYCYMYN